MKKNLLPSIVLGSICLVVAVLLSVVNSFTAPIIRERQEEAANAALLEVLPGGSDFKEIEITADYPSIVTKGWVANGGSVFQMEVTGYKSGLVIMCGVDADGKIAGVKHIASNETFGAEGQLNVDYTAAAPTLDSLTQLPSTSASGAPLTTKAYYDAIKAALQSAILASGGSVDTRTPEEIFQDDCNAALGTTDLTFTRWFATEQLEGIDKAYVTTDNNGFVFMIGETLIGVNETGVVTQNVSAEDSEKALAAYTLASTSTYTEITLPEGVGAEVKKAYVTTTGNYIFELEGKGYDALFEYSNGHMSGNPQPIVFKLSISADGAIIDCVTVKHSESKGYGDACATEEYYDQYHGKVNEDINVSVSSPDYMIDQIPNETTDVGAISNATYTTYGYQKAVKAAFKAFQLLTSD